MHSLSKGNPVSLVRIFLSEQGSERKLADGSGNLNPDPRFLYTVSAKIIT